MSSLYRVCLGLLSGTILSAQALPVWFLEPPSDRPCGVGSGATMHIALLGAKADLSKRLKIQVESESLLQQASNRQAHFETRSRQTSNNLIKNAKPVNTAEIDGMLYVQVCLDGQEKED